MIRPTLGAAIILAAVPLASTALLAVLIREIHYPALPWTASVALSAGLVLIICLAALIYAITAAANERNKK